MISSQLLQQAETDSPPRFCSLKTGSHQFYALISAGFFRPIETILHNVSAASSTFQGNPN